MLMTIAIAVAALIIVAVVWLLLKRRRTTALRERFGPEYDHVLHATRTPAEAERELEQRQKRVETFSLRPLSRQDMETFAASWKSVQARFVDDPKGAVVDADRLITEVMRARGYPVDDPTRRLDDLSVEHAYVLDHYRAGRDIMTRHERGEASTEDLRQAMVHCRALFDELVAGKRRDVRRAS